MDAVAVGHAGQADERRRMLDSREISALLTLIVQVIHNRFFQPRSHPRLPEAFKLLRARIWRWWFAGAAAWMCPRQRIAVSLPALDRSWRPRNGISNIGQEVGLQSDGGGQ